MRVDDSIMKKLLRILLKTFTVILISILSIVALFFLVRFIGQQVNKITPEGGINESMYVEINGTQQWISIYGQDKNNPVLLYLHGGPGSSSSAYDYAFTRQWADEYTVVTWDQRNCGKSYSEDQNDTELTYDLMMSDGVEITNYLRDYLGKEKITLLGHSWGTYLGSNLVLEYPELYECYIGVGQLVDMDLNEEAFREVAMTWVGNDTNGLALIDQLTIGDYSQDYYAARNQLMQMYGYDMFADETDYNMLAAEYFNPYYSLADFWNVLNSDWSVYEEFLNSDEFDRFSLIDETEYQVPVFYILGDRDYQTNYLIAQDYFATIDAPYQDIFIMEDTRHGLLETKSDEFSEILHRIAQL